MAGRVRRAVALAAVALALVLVWVPGSAAAQDAIAEWCEVDPALVVRTPAGRVVLLHVTTSGLGLEHLGAVRQATISSTTSPVGGGPDGAFRVEVVVEVPLGAGGERFATKSVVSTRPYAGGTVLAAASGESGSPMRLAFRLDEP
jgi:hypothetical protein